MKNRPLSKLERRIIDISYKLKKPHVGPCLDSVNLIDKIYKIKKPNEPFILSNGHVGLALYVVLEKYEGKNAEKLCLKYNTHPRRNLEDGIWCTTGSLGHGLPIAVGMAISNLKRKVWLLTSDGEMAEGSMWEALRIAGEQKLKNLKITVNANGHGAFSKIDTDLLKLRIQKFFPSLVIKTNLSGYPDFLQGVPGHCVILNDEQYKKLINE